MADRYWVGSGVLADDSHWADGPKEDGGASYPVAGDNVYLSDNISDADIELDADAEVNKIDPDIETQKYEQGFEGTFPPDNWIIENGGSELNPSKSSIAAHTGTYSLRIPSTLNIAITPKVNKNVTLKFFSAAGVDTNQVKVDISTDFDGTSGGVSGATWTTIQTFSNASVGTWYERNIDLSAYEYFYIRFYKVTGGVLYIDDIEITEDYDSYTGSIISDTAGTQRELALTEKVTVEDMTFKDISTGAPGMIDARDGSNTNQGNCIGIVFDDTLGII